MDNKEELIKEMEFCLKLWEEKDNCEFGGKTKCNECATLYLLLKLINGEILHGKDIKRLTLEDWKQKLTNIKQN